MKAMKLIGKLWILILVLAIAAPTTALASSVKDSGVLPAVDDSGNLMIPALPQGKVVRLVIWNDDAGTTREMGAATSAKLNNGDGWNWEWTDANGKRYWHLITQSSKVGANYGIDPWKNPKSGKIECKYIYKK